MVDARPRSVLLAPIAVSLLVMAAASGCQRPLPADAPVEDIYARRCATCHGAEGAGNGPAAARLGVRPRDFRSVQWHDLRSDEDIARAIVEGGAAAGPSGLMPPHPDLAPRASEMTAWIRSMKGRQEPAR